MWLRTVTFTFKFNCCYEDIPQLDREAESETTIYRKRYSNKNQMEEALVVWADKSSENFAKIIANTSCEELRFPEESACNIETTIINVTEIEEKPKVPEYINKVIERLEKLRNEATSEEIKIRYQKAIDDTKKSYGTE